MLMTTSENMANEAEPESPVDRAWQIMDLMLSVMSDGLDHPELWSLIPSFIETDPLLVSVLQTKLGLERSGSANRSIRLLLGLCGAASGEVDEMIEALAPLAADDSQSPLVQGVLFHLRGLADPDNPKYSLVGKICDTPFQQMDVLERTTHLCCASWLSTSAGDLSSSDWREVWNSETAQAIRASVHDGSYRYCNKGACPKIQSNALPAVADMAARSSYWADLLNATVTALPAGPEIVNLAYDRTCNLSCPSCRVERFAADEATRSRFADMQQRSILPLLSNAKTVFVTGSGDPFASKNFRQLMRDLTPEVYPDLCFQIMTNGMLFTPAQWASFPSLHGRVKTLKISIDAATGPTHELLRRGARWPTMLENMAFAGDLTARGLVDHFELVFTVQIDNYREMGDAVDLAYRVGATGIYFARLTNWGTFTAESYREKAVFLSLHPEHEQFIEQMRDARLKDKIVILGDLEEFIDIEMAESLKFYC